MAKSDMFCVDKNNANHDPYVFTLSSRYKELAKKELMEDEETRQQSLAHLREWIGKHPYIQKCRTDAVFLLRFLRFRKFSVPQAQAALERYLAMRQTFPEWFQKLDTKDTLVQGTIDDEVFTVLGRDGEGRTVVWIRFGRFNVEKLSPIAIFRYTMMFLETLMDDEEVQIGGYRVWVDYTESTVKHYGMWGVSDMKMLMDAVNRSMPMRIREISGAKLPKFAIVVANLLLSFASKKLKERVTCHSTVLESKKNFDESLWPQQYGGLKNSADLAHSLRKQFSEKRDAILALDDMEIEIEHYSSMWNQTSVNDNSGDIDGGIAGCFRKLNVD
ncbi:retinaldehyde-binding protein 1-like [Topomyia yanbarensis]|uniref:retinaldehyde-binding protein 1-like n=1 Tax=Topomyia yanbarensis TaxID=2498891 RepID=UPI00273BF307|nr:retinaldehyde-binding protein 1-like [Topomyia yanbarensis]XP_058837453.1 retinaldehyde-binding protein 1-like [Topomyia yanbarensis]XP_058837454.1 retinaldehyde-binding protein 1-like [Topomyia yanbarensis]XP_058837455.1 retinaldehyde-binding protein 1-like [Topomyia yanbarensis]XP_058837456.1 retinaldehyde-binding protein 1-like [Topomyia yanbarensis]